MKQHYTIVAAGLALFAAIASAGGQMAASKLPVPRLFDFGRICSRHSSMTSPVCAFA